MISNLSVVPEASGTVRTCVNEGLMDRPEPRMLLVGEYREVFTRAGRKTVRLKDSLLIPIALCIPV